MKRSKQFAFLISIVPALAAWTAAARAADKVEFTPVANFLKIPGDVELGKCSAVALDSADQLYLFHRVKTPILCFNKDGQFVRGWGDDYLHTPHGLRIDRHDNIWVTDIGQHLVLKFDPRGKLLLTLGTSSKPGTGIDQFNKPTDIAFGRRDEVYVSDGYGNSRVLEFDQRGKFVKTWGRAGDGPGEFDLPHAIKVDSRQRILVGDRENRRIQVFDGEGRHLSTWKGFAPYGIEIDRDGRIFVADTVAHQIHQLDELGNVVNSWGGRGNQPGQFDAPHMLACDSAGNLYVAEVDGRRMQKFVRKK